MKYVLVHGTFDTDESLEGDRWWQKGSQFWQQLTEHVAEEDIIQFRWSGENSQDEREKAAKELSNCLKLIAKSERVAVIAHSHGGNVAELCMIHLEPAARMYVHITTVGAPFLKTRKGVQYQYNRRELVLIAIIAAALAYSIYYVLAYGFYFITPTQANGSMNDLAEIVAAFLVVGFPLVVFRPVLFPRARKIFWWVTGKYLSYRPNKMNIIVHQSDEALQLLENVHRLKVKPIGTRSLATGFTTLAIPMASVLSIIAFIGPIVVYGMNGVELVFSGFTIFIIIICFFFAFIVFFLAAVILTILLSCFGWVLSVPLAPSLNRLLTNVIKSSAFGVAPGTNVLSVSRIPQSPSLIIDLPKEIINELIIRTNEALGERVPLMKQMMSDAPELSADTLALLQDTFQWNELIHTYYFRHPECCQLIVDTVILRPRQ